MKVTLYKQPDGRTQELEIKNVRPEDEAWFKEHGVQLSMEDVGAPGAPEFAIYAAVGEGEGSELLELSKGRSCEDTLTELRKQAEAQLRVCPDDERHADDITGCGMRFFAMPDPEGMVDCPHCGMFFKVRA